MDKAKYVFEKYGMGYPAGFAIGATGMTSLALLSGSSILHDKKKKKASKKNMVKKSNFKKEAIGVLGVGTALLIAGSLAPKPRKTATSITNAKGKNIKMKKMINLPKPK